MFAEKVVKPESEVTPCSDARRFLYSFANLIPFCLYPSYNYCEKRTNKCFC